MRTREVILKDWSDFYGSGLDVKTAFLSLEVLLDIRDLLSRAKLNMPTAEALASEMNRIKNS